jgi:hypothetical protein
MAMLHSNNYFTHNSISDYDVPIETYDTPIGGKLLKAEFVLRGVQFNAMDTLDIKKELAKMLAGKMLELGLVEFTKLEDPMTGNTIYRSRCFVAESGDVKVLRTAILR